MMTLLICLFTSVLSASEIDYLSLASVLLRDGNYVRAKSALTKAKKSWDDIEREHYYLLDGLLKLRTNKVDEAIAQLSKISDSEYITKRDTYMAQAFLEKKELKKSLSWIKKVNISSKTPVSISHLRAKIYFENGMIDETFKDLNEGAKKAKNKSRKLMVHYMLKLELKNEAYALIREICSDYNQESVYLQMARLMVSKDMNEQAVLLLEEAAIKYPTSVDVLKLLAASYDLKKKTYVAGDLYTKLAYIDNSYAHLAAEYLKQKGRGNAAMVINMTVDNPKKKLSQRLAYYIEQERFDLASSLETPLRQFKVYKDDDIKYAMAYTYLMQGDYQHSLRLLKNIKKSGLLTKSVKLMELVNDCKTNRWECYGTL
jgi:outer membrane PBP1 activator LpoA protein